MKKERNRFDPPPATLAQLGKDLLLLPVFFALFAGLTFWEIFKYLARWRKR